MDAEYLERFLSDSARGATRSEIRELLKLAGRPEIISLAGGMPSAATFPIAELADVAARVLREEGAAALQYGTTEGDLGLRRELLRVLCELEGQAFASLTPDHVLVTSASQQSIDLCSRAFVSPYDSIVVGLPSYLAALSAFRASGARPIGIPMDDEGIRPDLLEERLVGARRRGIHPKLLYVVPDFANPTGGTLGRARRIDLLSLARDFDLLVIEDSPYRALRFSGEAPPTLGSLDRDGRVISLFSFSKILAPGLRLGWIVAHPDVVSRLVVTKQPVDLCTSGFVQLVVRGFLRSHDLRTQIERARRLYAGQRDALLAALERHIDPSWGVRWTRPEGGLFLWVVLPAWMDARQLLEVALRDFGVAFVVGDAFHCDGSGRNTLRLNFSYVDPARLDEGAARLARAIERMLERSAEGSRLDVGRSGARHGRGRVAAGGVASGHGRNARVGGSAWKTISTPSWPGPIVSSSPGGSKKPRRSSRPSASRTRTRPGADRRPC